MRRYSARILPAAASAAVAAVLLMAGLAALGAGYLFTFGRRPKGAAQVTQPGGHETITPANAA